MMGSLGDNIRGRSLHSPPKRTGTIEGILLCAAAMSVNGSSDDEDLADHPAQVEAFRPTRIIIQITLE